MKRKDEGTNRWAVFAASRPAPLFFWYRQSPRILLPWAWQHSVSWDPPQQVTGMAYVSLDPRGRLLELSVVPPQRDASTGSQATESAAQAPDWAPLFGSAGLDISKFHSTGSIWNLPFDCDARFAWMGAYNERPDVPIRVEAGAWRGKPVAFSVIAPWATPGLQEERPKSAGERATSVIFISVVGLILGAGVFFARRNLRLGRGDRKGAFRLAAFLFALYLGSNVLALHHVADSAELTQLLRAAADALFYSGMIWLLYIALEPYVRRLRPEVLISWSRLLAGRIRDPRVGRDLLIGGVAGSFLALGVSLHILLPAWLGRTPTPPDLPNLAVLSGFGPTVAGLLQSFDLAFPVFLLFLILLARVTLRNQWLALGAITILWSSVVALQSENALLDLVVFVPLVALVLYVLMRFGLLAMVGMVLLTGESYLVPFNASSWYLGAWLLHPLVVIALAVFAFRISLAGRPLFGGDLLRDSAEGRSPSR